MRENKALVYLLVGFLILGGIASGVLATRAYAGLPLLMPTPTENVFQLEDEGITAQQEELPPPSNPTVPDDRIVIGDVVEIGEGSIVVSSTKRGLVTLQIGPETRYWKGRWDSQLPIEVGDHVGGYGEPNEDGTVFDMEQIEVNVVSLRGPVLTVSPTASGLDIVLEESYTGDSILIHVEPDTLVTTESGENTFEKTPIEIKVGDGFHIIGLRLEDGSVLATRLF